MPIESTKASLLNARSSGNNGAGVIAGAGVVGVGDGGCTLAGLAGSGGIVAAAIGVAAGGFGTVFPPGVGSPGVTVTGVGVTVGVVTDCDAFAEPGAFASEPGGAAAGLKGAVPPPPPHAVSIVNRRRADAGEVRFWCMSFRFSRRMRRLF